MPCQPPCAAHSCPSPPSSPMTLGLEHRAASKQLPLAMLSAGPARGQAPTPPARDQVSERFSPLGHRPGCGVPLPHRSSTQQHRRPGCPSPRGETGGGRQHPAPAPHPPPSNLPSQANPTASVCRPHHPCPGPVCSRVAPTAGGATALPRARAARVQPRELQPCALPAAQMDGSRICHRSRIWLRPSPRGWAQSHGARGQERYGGHQAALP